MPRRARALACTLVPLALTLLGGAPPQAGSTGTGPVVFAATAPTPEQDLGATLLPVFDHDEKAFLAANVASHACIITLSDGTLRFARSSDEGRSWSADKVVDGVDTPVLDFAAFDRGAIHLAYTVLNGTRHEVRFRRSDDMCETWGAAVVAQADLDTNRVWAIHANGLGGVAIAAESPWYGRDVWVVSSADGGATWGRARRVDPADTGNAYPSTQADVVVGANGRVYCAFVRGVPGTDAAGVYYTSAALGAAFATERSFGALLPGGADGRSLPRLAITASGAVLLAFAELEHGYVLRSPDGETFSVKHSFFAPGLRSMEIQASPSGNKALVLAASESRIPGASSVDDGVTWVPESPFFTGGDDVRIAWSSAGTWLAALASKYMVQVSEWAGGFGLPISVDGGFGFQKRLAGVTPVSSRGVLVAYLDGRDDLDRAFNVYCNRGDTTPLGFPDPDVRADQDAGVQRPGVDGLPAAATSGQRVYVGFLAQTRHWQGMRSWGTDPYVAWSADRGSTWTTTLLDYRGDLDQPDRADLVLEAVPGTTVAYAAWRDLTFESTVEFRQTDGGPRWWGDYIGMDATGAPAIAANESGIVMIAWPEFYGVRVAWSTNGGQWFEVPHWFPTATPPTSVRLHMTGNVAVLAWADASGATARVSTTDGATWSAPRQWPATSASVSSVRCTIEMATIAWTENVGGREKSWYASWYQGNWYDAAEFTSDGSGDVSLPVLAFTGDDQVLAAAAVRSRSNGGDRIAFYRGDAYSGFGAPVFLDDAAPQPAAMSLLPHIAAGSGRVAVMWTDHSAGLPQAAIRVSADGGLTFDAVRRLSTDTPQNAWSSYPTAPTIPSQLANLAPSGIRQPALVMVGGTAVGAFPATRRGAFRTVVANALAVDEDGDARLPALDCNDQDYGAWAVPVEVSGLACVRAGGAARLTWDSQSGSAGGGTGYDVAGGDLAGLRLAAGPSVAACLADGVGSPYLDDDVPPAGRGRWYLVRAQNSCGASVFSALGPPAATCP